MRYITVTWPDIQEYMFREDFYSESYYDSNKNTWLIPESWIENTIKIVQEEVNEFGMTEWEQYLEGLGGDWEG